MGGGGDATRNAAEAGEEAATSPFHASPRERKASALMDAVALGAPADARTETARSWDAVRGAVAEQYEQGGLEAYAAFVRGA